MRTPFVISLLAVVAIAGVVLLVMALFAQRKYAAMHAAKTMNVADLSARPPGGGVTCEIKGAADPGPAGRLAGPMSGRECVWFRTKTEERWTEYERDGQGRGRHRSRSRVLDDRGSPPHFGVRDNTGVALLDLRQTKVDSPVRSYEQAVPAHGRSFTDMPGVSGVNRRDHRIVYTEDLVAPGQPIYALGMGMTHPQTGGVTMAKPDQGPFIVSTRSEEQLSKGAVLRMRIGYIAGGVLFLAGAAGLTVSALAG